MYLDRKRRMACSAWSRVDTCRRNSCEMAAPKPAGNKKATEPPEDIPAAKNSGGSCAGAGRKPEKQGLGAAKTTGTQLSLATLGALKVVWYWYARPLLINRPGVLIL